MFCMYSIGVGGQPTHCVLNVTGGNAGQRISDGLVGGGTVVEWKKIVGITALGSSFGWSWTVGNGRAGGVGVGGRSRSGGRSGGRRRVFSWPCLLLLLTTLLLSGRWLWSLPRLIGMRGFWRMGRFWRRSSFALCWGRRGGGGTQRRSSCFHASSWHAGISYFIKLKHFCKNRTPKFRNNAVRIVDIHPYETVIFHFGFETKMKGTRQGKEFEHVTQFGAFGGCIFNWEHVGVGRGLAVLSSQEIKDMSAHAVRQKCGGFDPVLSLVR